jgi:hypothetical protein
MVEIKNRKGWIRLVEVFVCILLLTGILLVISNRDSSYQTDVNKDISKKEFAILRDIEMNNQMRANILSVAQASLPLEWEDFSSAGLEEIRERIIELSPTELECRAKICLLNDLCMMDWASVGDIYSESVVIAADLDNYFPRQFKLFCTMKSG